ncbi:MAG: glucose-6-phosphate isomerase [Rubripirellula sp.]
MNLLRFDPIGSIGGDHGITAQQIESMAGRLSDLRDELGQASPGESFIGLPLETLTGYERDREASDLGRIFKVANGMHDDMDAVLVLGTGDSYLAAQALKDACCDPYHNELSRGARGSKPRMYFCGNSFDNDATAALLTRLTAGGSGDSKAEQRFAIVAADSCGDTLETSVALRQYLSALECSLVGDGEVGVDRLLIPVTGPAGKLRDLATALGCREVLDSADCLGSCNVFSNAGLLPAAMLGLDCIQLLGGAIAITEHFRTASYEENVILKFAAINYLLSQHRGKNIRVLSLWNKALESFGHWYEHLVSQSLAGHETGVTSMPMVNSRDLHGRLAQLQRGRNDMVFHHVLVENDRSDRLGVGNSHRDQDSLNDIADRTLPEMMRAAFEVTGNALRVAGRPTTEIVLPAINPHVLGQLFQMLIIASTLEARLAGQSPDDSAATDRTTFKQQLDSHLGRFGTAISP